jgi:hypothetical protein
VPVFSILMLREREREVSEQFECNHAVTASTLSVSLSLSLSLFLNIRMEKTGTEHQSPGRSFLKYTLQQVTVTHNLQRESFKLSFFYGPHTVNCSQVTDVNAHNSIASHAPPSSGQAGVCYKRHLQTIASCV